MKSREFVNDPDSKFDGAPMMISDNDNDDDDDNDERPKKRTRAEEMWMPAGIHE